MTAPAKGCQRVPGVQHSSPYQGRKDGARKGAAFLSPRPAPFHLDAASAPSQLESEAKGADGCHTERHPVGAPRAPLLLVLARLRHHLGGAIVAILASELGVRVGLTKRRVYALRRQGLVTSDQLGTPPVAAWRSSP